MNARQMMPKKLTIADWTRILRDALTIAEEKRHTPNLPVGNNYGCPFWLIPRKPKSDGEKK